MLPSCDQRCIEPHATCAAPPVAPNKVSMPVLSRFGVVQDMYLRGRRQTQMTLFQDGADPNDIVQVRAPGGVLYFGCDRQIANTSGACRVSLATAGCCPPSVCWQVPLTPRSG